MRDTQRKEEGWQFGSEEIFFLWVDKVAEQSILLKQERFTLKPPICLWGFSLRLHRGMEFIRDGYFWGRGGI